MSAAIEELFIEEQKSIINELEKVEGIAQEIGEVIKAEMPLMQSILIDNQAPNRP